MPDDPVKSDAARVAEIRDLLPTTLGSAEIRGEIAADVRARSVFVARCANVIFLTKVKEVVDSVANGEMDKGTAVLLLYQTLQAIGYTPEGGFPDDPPGAVPPALAGTLQDLSSLRRLKLIIDTQVALMNGKGQQLRGMESERFRQFPAWELVRIASRRVPRKWGGEHEGTPPRYHGQVDLRSRWTIAGGTETAGRLVALKGDPVWGELGASENFEDALDVDFPPFAWNSGMGWRELTRAECAELGITGPDGETPDEWQASAPPVLSTVPPPAISVRGADPELVTTVTASIPAVRVDDTLTPPDNADELRRRIAERRAARAARAAVPIYPP